MRKNNPLSVKLTLTKLEHFRDKVAGTITKREENAFKQKRIRSSVKSSRSIKKPGYLLDGYTFKTKLRGRITKHLSEYHNEEIEIDDWMFGANALITDCEDFMCQEECPDGEPFYENEAITYSDEEIRVIVARCKELILAKGRRDDLDTKALAFIEKYEKTKVIPHHSELPIDSTPETMAKGQTLIQECLTEVRTQKEDRMVISALVTLAK